MKCACQTGSRQLQLQFEVADHSLSEDLGSYRIGRGRNETAWSVEVGGNSSYRTPEDIANFLGLFFPDELLEDIECIGNTIPLRAVVKFAGVIPVKSATVA